MSTFLWVIAAPVVAAEVIVLRWVIVRLEPWWLRALADFVEAKNRQREERHQ